MILKIQVLESSRADRAILNGLKSEDIQLSRSELKDLFASGKVRSNERVLKPSDILRPGTYLIEINHEISTREHLPQPSNRGSFLPIIHEDENILVLNKESGTPSAPLSSSETETAVGSALAHFPALIHVPGLKSLEPGLVHRLDTQTSGLLVFAKSSGEFERLRNLWKARQIRKIYRAWVKPKNPFPNRLPITLNIPLGHDAGSSKKMVALLENRHRVIRGKPFTAVTHLLKIWSKDDTNSRLDIEVQIDTGVMHQIRCHLSSQGWPIHGDALYGGSPATRLYLHAWRLEIPSPSGKALILEAPLPQEWKRGPEEYPQGP